MRWVGRVAHMGERRGAYRVLVGKSEGSMPLGTPRCIKMNVQDKVGGAWTKLVWLEMAVVVINL